LRGEDLDLDSDCEDLTTSLKIGHSFSVALINWWWWWQCECISEKLLRRWDSLRLLGDYYPDRDPDQHSRAFRPNDNGPK